MPGFSKFASLVIPFFERHPVIKSSVSAGGLMCLGDAISQTVIEKTEKYDFIRTARFGLIGSAMIGPALHKWYGILERTIKFSHPGARAFSKMAADQLTFAPIFLFGFFWVNGALQGKPKEEIQKHVSRDYVDVLIANYKLWPAVQIINFYFVPLSQRVVFVQTVALVWNTYLAWKINRADDNYPTVAAASPDMNED